MRELAGSFDPDLPGLPRGRAKLTAGEVQHAQRNRILRAVIDATAHKGIHAITIADIVARARVSRQAFYQQFESKEACLIAAVDRGIEVVRGVIGNAIESSAELTAWQQLSTVVGSYLQICDSEPEFARSWVVDLALCGEPGVAKRNEYLNLVAETLRDFYSAQLIRDPIPPLDEFIAAVGGCNELFYRHTVAGRASYQELHGPILDFLVRFLHLSDDGA